MEIGAIMNAHTRNGRGFGVRMLLLATLPAAALMLTGCQSNKADERALLIEENDELRARVAEQNRALGMASDELRERDQRIAELRSELNAAQQAARTPAAPTDPFAGIDGVRGSVGGGEVRAIVDGDILFASGQATLRDASKRALDQVARVITTQYPGRSIRVAGHTDSDPIRRSGFETNHHLGFARAWAVRGYLISRGVPANQVYVASFGPDRPESTKSRSRRVEIAVVLSE